MHPLTDSLNTLIEGLTDFRETESVQSYLKNYFSSKLVHTQSHLSLGNCKGSTPFPTRRSVLKNLISVLSSESLDVIMMHGSLQVGDGISSQVRYFCLYPYPYDQHKLSYAPERPCENGKCVNGVKPGLLWQRSSWSSRANCSLSVRPISGVTRLLNQPSFWTLLWPQKCQNSDKMIIHASVKNTWIYSILLWALNLGRVNPYFSDGHYSYKVRQSSDLLSLSRGNSFIADVQESVLLRAV